MASSVSNTLTFPVLTMGYTDDIQHANMLKDAKAAGAAAPASLNGTVAMPGLGLEAETWTRRDSPLIRPSPVSSRSSDRLPRTGQSSLSTSRSQSSVTTPRSKTPESLRLDIGSKSPSLTPADQSKRHRAGSSLAPLLPSPAKPTLSKDNLIVSARGASSLTPAVSAISASTSFSQLPSTAELPSPLSEPAPSASRATVSSLLDQLTQTHDRQQRERTVEWDAFLRRRAKSKGSSETKHGTRNGLEDSKWGVGIIGVNQMGASGSEEYKAFRRLVRRGIPMVYRSDVWAGEHQSPFMWTELIWGRMFWCKGYDNPRRVCWNLEDACGRSERRVCRDSEGHIPDLSKQRVLR